MKNKLIFFGILMVANFSFAHTHSSSKPKIVTSTTPIASVTSAILKDGANVVAIDDGSSGCPHHYHMRPSDKEKVEGAKILIYINDNFDGFASTLLDGFLGRTIKISEIDSINFTDTYGKNNWHFWLDLKNILQLQSTIADAALQEWPNMTEEINANKIKADQKVQDLIALKEKELQGLGEVVLMSDSLEHFFTGVDAKIVKLYQKSSASLRDFEKLENILNIKTPQCIILDSAQDAKPYEKYGKKIVQLESENWSLEHNHHHGHKHADVHHHEHAHDHHHEHDISNLFYDKYLKMIEKLQDCR